MSSTIAPPAAQTSFADPAVHACPFAAYAMLREQHPVYHDPLTGNFVLTRYSDIRKVMLNPRLFSSKTGLVNTRESGVKDEANRLYAEHGWMPVDTLLTNDPPHHRVFRTLVDKAFAPARVAALEPRIERIIADLVEKIDGRDEIEFLADFAIKLPMIVIAEQLGVAAEHMDRFKLWSDCSVESVSPVLPPERELEVTRVIIEMQQYLSKVIDRVRAVPEDTLLSHLVHAETDGRRLETGEILSILHQLLVAGNETTTTTLAAGMKLLIDQPDLAERLYENPHQIDRFVEETLRTMAPIQTMFRRANAETEIQGVVIPENGIIEVRFGAANRDPAVYPIPDDVDLERTNANTHMAFGAGIHLCIGNQLARGELRLAFRALLARFGNFRMTRGDDSCAYTASYIQFGLTRLWMAFDKR